MCHGVTSFTWAFIGKTCQISLYLAIRPRLSKFCIKLYLVGLYLECQNYSPGVKFGPNPGVTRFFLAYIDEMLEISLYLAIRPTLTKFTLVLYQECPNYSPGVKLASPWGSQLLHWLLGKTLGISLCLAIRPRLTKFCM